MKIQSRIYTQTVHVILTNVRDDDVKEIAGMLRGLQSSIEGWTNLGGRTDEYFTQNNPVKLRFVSVDNAKYFKECVEYYFSNEIMQQLSVRVKRKRIK